MKLRTGFATVAGALTLLALSGQAGAIPILSISNNAGASVTVADGDAADANPIEGAVTYVGTLAGWSVVVSTGLSAPVLGSAEQPILHLGSISASSQHAGTLSVALSDTDFVLSGDARAAATIGGVTTGSVSYQTFFDAANTAFAQTSSLVSLGDFNGGFSGSAGGSFTLPDLYSLTLLVNVTHGSGSYEHSSFDAVLTVPEPGSLALLGAGLVLLAFGTRRRPTLRAATA